MITGYFGNLINHNKPLGLWFMNTSLFYKHNQVGTTVAQTIATIGVFIED